MPDPLFNYTSGAWLVNNSTRLLERKHSFNRTALCRLAAHSVGKSLADIASLEKLAEGGFNRTFLVTMTDGFQLVARIPYPATQPKFYAVSSEVATMDFLRASGLPIPEVYAYSPTPDNAANVEYIFMEFVQGTKLTDVWMQLEEAELASVLRQLVEFESLMMSISFPAGGSLYYADDLEKAGAEAASIPVSIHGERFCIGPDARLHMWYGKPPQLDIDRGPYKTAEAVLAAAARKEIAYLARFGKPLLPFRRERRESYDYEQQSHMDHIKTLEDYLRMTPLLVPDSPPARQFSIQHPDLHPSNTIVSLSPDSSQQVQIVGLLDWQHTAILPRFLIAGIPDRLQQNDDSPVSLQTPVAPSFPANISEMTNKSELVDAIGRYQARLAYFHYLKHTAELNGVHYDCLVDSASCLARRLFREACGPWEGESHDLKALLIEATEQWEALAGAGVPCPVTFDTGAVANTKALGERLTRTDEHARAVQCIVGFESETWVPSDHRRKAKARAEPLKLKLLLVLPKGKLRDQRAAH